MPPKIIRRKVEDLISSNDLSSSGVSPGSYAISSLELKPWAATSVTVSRPKTRRAKPNLTIVNPIFKECADLVEDPTWKTIFNESALGKLPRAFTFKDGYITHKIRNKISRINFSTNPEVAIKECIHFFKEKAGIMSQEDQRKAREEFEDYLLKSGALCPNRWSEIRKKKVRDVLISTFIARLTREIGLSITEKADLRNKIYLGFILGCFGNEQVELKDGYIRNITGLEFDPDTRTFYIDYSLAPKQIKKSRRVEKPGRPKNSFYILWIKFLETLEKRVGKNNSMRLIEASTEDPNSNDLTSPNEDNL
ncbi:MAG: hypothetical protein ACYC0H_22290 [Solirubrobacteraceae bacterium]